MSYIPYHPAPGLADLVPGWHAVPQNPIRDAGTPLKASLAALYPNQIIYRPRLADLVRASFTVPQNPLRSALSGCGCSGGGCSGGCSGVRGLGQFSLDEGIYNTSGWLMEPQGSFGNLPTWALLTGAFATAWIFFGRERKRHR